MIALDFAPMESLGSAVFRRLHFRYFGSVDTYGIAFITPTREARFTERQLREIAPEVNEGIPCVPQLLTRRSGDFIWAAKALFRLGYSEVNLNLGCPAGTVVAKGKGAGFLRSPIELEQFLNEIFSEIAPEQISIKTRLGWSDESEFERLSAIFSQFPIKRLTVHARLKTDQYRGHARVDSFEKAVKNLPIPIGYNGDIVTPEDYKTVVNRFPNLDQIMVGRGLIADPALFRKIRGGKRADQKELQAFTEELFEGYAQAWGSRKNAMMRMKEYWFLLSNLFGGDAAKDLKAICKARSESDYQSAVQSLLHEPILESTRFGWYKPLD